MSRSWRGFLEDHARVRERALASASALEQGDAAPAAALLAPWELAATGALEPLLQRLLERPAQPSAQQLQATLAGPQAWASVPQPEQPLGPLQARAWLESRAPAAASGPAPGSAWALANLAFLGTQVDRLLRAPWRDEMHPNSDQDAVARRLWEAWFSGQVWDMRETWEALYLPIARRAFAGVALAKGVPRERWPRLSEELEEGFFWAMLGADSESAGWRGVALRVVETTGAGPVDGLASLLERSASVRAAGCAISRGHGPSTAGLLFPELPRRWGRMVALSGLWREHPGAVNQWLNAHVAVRLVDHWAVPGNGGIAQAWRVATQNRGRARGRLRAVLQSCWDQVPIHQALMSTQGLGSRTQAAVARWSRDWAWKQLSVGFSFSEHAGLDPSCPPDDELPLQILVLNDRERGLLRTWVALVCMRGRLEHLQRWVQRAGTGDRDSQWGRLLSDALPQELRARFDGLPGLRAYLATELQPLLGEVEDVLSLLSEVEDGPGLSRRFQQNLDQWWSLGVPRPSASFRRCIERADASVAMLRDMGDIL